MTPPRPNLRLPILLLLVSTGINALQLFSPELGDLALYREIGERVLRGEPLYGEHPFEYPPYVVVWWILPAARSLLTGRESAFIKPFGLELLAIDAGIKWLLLVEGRKAYRGVRGYLPFAFFALAALGMQHIFLRRFDLIPAGMTIASIALLATGWPLLSGLLLAAGIGTKLYPVVLVPLCFVVAWRKGQLQRWLVGGALGLAPLVILAGLMPWWKFTQAHRARGLQVESIYAGFIWLAHRLGGRALWVRTPEGTNVGGDLAEMILPWGKVLWVSTTLLSLGVTAWRARNSRLDMQALSRLALVPLTAFVGFNFVLSPQYMIWLAGFVGLAATVRWDWRVGFLAIATLMTPLIYPTPSYEWGYDMPHVLALCLRNVMLVTAWAGLVLEAVKAQRGETAVTSLST